MRNTKRNTRAARAWKKLRRRPSRKPLLLSKPLPNLVKLTLAENQIDNTIGKVLATAASNVPKLEQLELAGNKKLDGTAVKELGAAKLPAIRRIDLRKTRVKPDDIAALPLFRAGA